MAGGKDDASDRLPVADQMGCGGSGEDPAGGGDDLANTMGCGHAQDDIDGPPVAVASIAPKDQRAALHIRQCAEDRFNKALEIVSLLKLLAAFAQT